MPWASEAAGLLRDEADRAPQTPLRTFPLPPEWGVTLVLKDESAHPSGSLKHRLARALFRYGLTAGTITEGGTIVEATGGNAAVSAAHFARLLGLPFIAVVPGRTRPEKIARIEAHGGRCHRHDPSLAIYAEARRLAAETGGHYLDHFAHAVPALTADESPALAAELLGRLGSAPEWIVVGAGTGATSTMIGRHLRAHGLATRLAVADPENSAYFPAWAYDVPDYGTGMPSRIDGIGRPRVEPGFDASLVDLVVPVPDTASIAAARFLRTATGIRAGASTGTNLWCALRLIAGMLGEGRRGTVATLIADAGDIAEAGHDLAPHTLALERFLATGTWPAP
jgi:cysteine synthase A